MKITTVSILVGLGLPCFPAFAPNQAFTLPTIAKSGGATSYLSTRSTSNSVKIISSALAARRPLLSEDDLAAPPDQKVIEAVESLGGNDVLASDVAAKAGVSLSQTRQSLSSLASLTRGDISVTQSGDLLYSFPKSIKAALSSNSLRYRVTNTWLEKVWPNVFWGIRGAFGVFLFVSIAVIFSTLFFISNGGGSSDRDDRDDRRGGGGGLGFRYGIDNLLFDVFRPRPFYSSYGYYGRVDAFDRRQLGRVEEEEQERSGVFEGIFSYIFGDGDPNRTVEAARLREASKVIRQNDGAVTAEQLAPFCDVDDPDDLGDKFLVEEGFVLPIVSQLGGEPVVTDDGDIVYIFPDLQVSARGGDDDYEDLVLGSGVDYLEEKNVDFSRNPDLGNVAAAGLGVVNLGGALYLGQVLASPAMTGVQLAGMFGIVQAGYPLLVGYAFLFNLIPAARYFVNQKKNEEISKRNSARRKWKTYMDVGGSKIKRKLEAAKTLKQQMRRLGGESGEGTVYDTKKQFEEIANSKEQAEMKKFDELLGDNEPFS